MEHIISQKSNGAGHLYQDAKYAHFSQITEHNKHLFPSFKNASPQTFTLHKGDCLYIPSKWWHWVKSYGDRCLSVNFWFDTSSPIPPHSHATPTFYEGQVKHWKALDVWTDAYLIEKVDPKIPQGLWIWTDQFASKRHISLSEFIKTYKGSKEFAYLITPSGYEPKGTQGSTGNSHIVEILRDDFDLPFPEHMINPGANFWMNFGGIDTGLHFDDDPGFLCVVDGWKEVTLYPPSDSKFLHPYPLTPIKLEPFKKLFISNVYQEGPNLEGINFTSSQMLEASLLRAPNVASIALKLQKTFGCGRIVYGIKNRKGTIQWEFYFYGIDRTLKGPQSRQALFSKPGYNEDMHLLKYQKVHKELFPNDVYVWPPNTPGMIIFSYDLTEESVIKGETSHLNLYSVPGNSEEIQVPLLLVETTYPKVGKVEARSLQYVAKYDDVMSNIGTFVSACQKIGLNERDTSLIVRFVNGSPYKCLALSLVNKMLTNEIGLYFFGIAFDPFLKFLIDYDYQVPLIQAAVENKDDVSRLCLEVGFHFAKDSNDINPTRTAIYGLF